MSNMPAQRIGDHEQKLAEGKPIEPLPPSPMVIESETPTDPDNPMTPKSTGRHTTLVVPDKPKHAKR